MISKLQKYLDSKLSLESKIDQNLIAAAPEMLSALLDCINELEKYNVPNSENLVDRCAAIIEKAKGQ